MKTQVELLKESCDIKDAACVRYQKRIAELEEENKALRENVNHRAWRCADLSEENEKLRDYADNLDSENDNQAIDIEELKKENKELKTKINRVIDLFNRWDSSDLYDYIDDLDYEEN